MRTKILNIGLFSTNLGFCVSEDLGQGSAHMDTVKNWIFGSPHQQIQCWNPTPQWDGVRRWGLWEVIRIKWGCEGGASMMGLVPL